MLKNLLSIFILVISINFITSCSIADEGNPVTEFELNYDVIAHYSGENASLIKTDLAKTGNYCVQTDSSILYSSGYISKLKDLDKQIPNKISVEGYFMTKSNINDGAFVISVENPNAELISYQIAKTSELVKQNGEWTQFNLVLELDSLSNNPENILKLYGWNQGKDKTFYDDIKVKFE